MPELPEVETIRRSLRPVVTHHAITAVQVHDKKIVKGDQHTFVRSLIGKKFLDIDRVGKLLMFVLPGERYLLAHLKMTGQLVYAHGKKVIAGGHSMPGDPALSLNHVRAEIQFADGGKLSFNDMRRFGYLRLVDKKEKENIAAEFGIEPLAKGFTPEAFRDIFRGRKTTVKALLLNQKLITGIGNIYVDEICFAAKIRPMRLAARATRAEIMRLYHAAEAVMKHAIAERGTTFNTYVDGHGKGGNFVKHLKVYGRGGEPCVICHRALKKIRVAARGTVFCPYCQK